MQNNDFQISRCQPAQELLRPAYAYYGLSAQAEPQFEQYAAAMPSMLPEFMATCKSAIAMALNALMDKRFTESYATSAPWRTARLLWLCQHCAHLAGNRLRLTPEHSFSLGSDVMLPSATAWTSSSAPASPARARSISRIRTRRS